MSAITANAYSGKGVECCRQSLISNRCSECAGDIDDILPYTEGPMQIGLGADGFINT